MTPAEEGIVMAAARLARTAPEAWTMFLDAANIYSHHQAHLCVSSPLEFLPVAQGRAQNAARLLSLLADCQPSADKIEGRKK
jgi:hypothetical protein